MPVLNTLKELIANLSSSSGPACDRLLGYRFEKRDLFAEDIGACIGAFKTRIMDSSQSQSHRNRQKFSEWTAMFHWVSLRQNEKQWLDKNYTNENRQALTNLLYDDTGWSRDFFSRHQELAEGLLKSLVEIKVWRQSENAWIEAQAEELIRRKSEFNPPELTEKQVLKLAVGHTATIKTLQDYLGSQQGRDEKKSPHKFTAPIIRVVQDQLVSNIIPAATSIVSELEKCRASIMEEKKAFDDNWRKALDRVFDRGKKKVAVFSKLSEQFDALFKALGSEAKTRIGKEQQASVAVKTLSGIYQQEDEKKGSLSRTKTRFIFLAAFLLSLMGFVCLGMLYFEVENISRSIITASYVITAVGFLGVLVTFAYNEWKVSKRINDLISKARDPVRSHGLDSDRPVVVVVPADGALPVVPGRDYESSSL